MGSRDQTPAIGSVLDGKYRLDGVLGAGGMGRVFRGMHLGINRPVAIKLLHPELGRDAANAVRFQREALASGQLDHPNIVAISDVGMLGDGNWYLVMEVLEGETLGERLARDHRIAWSEVVMILRAMLAGLGHAHDAGIVHCDIKPDNVFLARKHGEVSIKLLDFGIARLLGAGIAPVGDAPQGMVNGTPEYVSPEQATGAELGPASDLYSLSIVAYEMVSGRVPFGDGDAVAKLTAHVNREPPPLAAELGVPASLDAVIRVGLAKSPTQRPASARDYQNQLDHVLATEGLPVPSRRAASVLPSTEATRGYEVVQSIGEGGMAEVFLARQRGLRGFQKLVVLKRLHPHLVDQPQLVEMFLDEARLAARVNDPHVVQIYELGETEGDYFIAMEYLLGESLDTMLATIATGRPAPTPHLVARIIADAAAGLHAAHELRDGAGRSLDLVHRDVTHANIVVLYSGGVKVVDFGIAKARSQLASATLHGKTGYISPEQLDHRTIDRRSDVFSLGIVLWEALTLRYLFTAQTDRDTLDRIRYGVPPPPSAFARVPPELDHIVLRALAKDPAARYQTAEAMRGDLEAFLRMAGQPAGALELAAYMTVTFPDRIAQRAQLLEAAEREGSELPVIARVAPRPHHHAPTTMLVIRRKRAPRAALAAAAACVLGVGAWGLFAHHGGDHASREAPAPTAPAHVAEALPTPAAPALPADPIYDQIAAAIDSGHLASPAHDSAVELLARADQLHPGDPRSAELRARAIGVLRTSAQVLWDHDKQASARVLYGELLELVPDDPIAKARVATVPARQPTTGGQTAAQLADVEWLVSQIDLAIIERRLVAPPGHDALDYLLALRKVDPTNEAARRLGTEVVAALHAEAAADPEQAPALAEAEKQVSDAGGSAATGSANKPASDTTTARTWVAQGKSLLAVGKFDTAATAFERAISADSRADPAFGGLAEVAFNKGDYGRAVLSAKRAVALAPSTTTYRMTLAKSYYKLMRYDDAIHEWQKVVELDPSNSVAKKDIELARSKAGN